MVKPTLHCIKDQNKSSTIVMIWEVSLDSIVTLAKWMTTVLVNWLIVIFADWPVMMLGDWLIMLCNDWLMWSLLTVLLCFYRGTC